MNDDFFDFGFTAVDEDELEAVQKVVKKAEVSQTEASSAQERLDKLYNAITPLLNNLKKNPEKEYILWPNRLEKVEQFEDHIQKIYKK
jgi:cell division protein FtsX|tara:strand:+ start:213 stop:476 length:264 start_codon:yes stop_codon:yes gene_type:complete